MSTWAAAMELMAHEVEELLVQLVLVEDELNEVSHMTQIALYDVNVELVLDEIEAAHK